MKRMTWIILGWLMLGITAQASSFDCAKAGSKVEHIICDNAEISKLDEELNAAYKTALQDEKQVDTVKQAQKQWMKERNGCADADCVKRKYAERLTLLKEKETYPQLPPKLRYAFCDKDKPELYCEGQTGKGYTVCEVYLKHLQTLTTPPSCEAPIPPGFSLPDWEEMDVTKNLDLAYQAEGLFLKKFGGYKHPEFDVWKATFLQEIKEGKINPRMRKAKVTPNDKGDAVILAYTRDRDACHKSFACETKRKVQLDQLPSDMPVWRKVKMFPECSDPYWRRQGDVHFILWEDLPEKLQAIGGDASRDQMELVIYAGRAYLVQVFNPLQSIYIPAKPFKPYSSIAIYTFDPLFPDRVQLYLKLDHHYAVSALCQLMPY